MINQPPEPEPQQEQSDVSLDSPEKEHPLLVIAKKAINKESANKLIQWTPFGTMALPFLSAWQKQEWILILQLSPVTILALIWAIYAEGFLEQLWEVLRAKGKEDVNNLKTGLQQIEKAVAETIRWQLAGTEDKYLKCRGNETQKPISCVGFRN